MRAHGRVTPLPLRGCQRSLPYLECSNFNGDKCAHALRPIYKPAMPKVYGVQLTSVNPAERICSISCCGDGKRATDAGRYLYGPSTPEMKVPTMGNTYRKYRR